MWLYVRLWPKWTIPRWRVVVGCYRGIRAMDPTRCASKDAGPPRGGWMKVPHIGSWEERTTPYKRGDTSTHRGTFWGQHRESRDGGSVPPAQCGQYLNGGWSWAVTMVSEPWNRPGVPARTLGPWEEGWMNVSHFGSCTFYVFLTYYLNSGTKRAEFPLKTDRFHAKKPYKSPCSQGKRITLKHSSTATR